MLEYIYMENDIKEHIVKEKLLVLGVESSCDESAMCLMEINLLENNDQSGADRKSFIKNERTILLDYVATHKNHNYGGVIPESAARQHFYYLPKMLERLKTEMSEKGMSLHDIDIVCATYGPGLVGGLMLGMCTGKSIAAALDKPFYPIHHIESHILSPMIENPDLCFPYVILVVSGGHTILVHAEDFKKYHILADTLDDAMGELFDKVAKHLGLPFPGGPEIEKLALNGDPLKYKFSLPVIKKDINVSKDSTTNTSDFSFSGLKTAMIRTIDKIRAENINNENNLDDKNSGEISNQDKADIAAGLQNVVVRIIEQKFRYVSELLPDVKNWCIAGGVASNKVIRAACQDFAMQYNKVLHIPRIGLCTDNAAMIAWNGYLHYEYDVKPNLSARVKNYEPCDELAIHNI